MYLVVAVQIRLQQSICLLIQYNQQLHCKTKTEDDQLAQYRKAKGLKCKGASDLC